MLAVTPTESAIWRPLYDFLVQQPYGTRISFEEIQVLTGLDITGTSNRWVVYRTDKELQRHHQMALTSVRAFGYRIASPEEHLELVRGRRKRAKRQTHKGVTAGLSANLSKISDPSVRSAITGLTTHLQTIESRLAYHEKRLLKAESELKSVSQTTASVADRVRKLEEILDAQTASDDSH